MLKKYYYHLFLALLALQLNACAITSSPEKLATNYSKNPRNADLINNISVGNVTGGHSFDIIGMPQIDNASLKEALKISLQRGNLYSNTGKYTLEANLIELDQPYFGLTFTVKSLVQYNLINTKTNQSIYNKKISAESTATVGDEPVATYRVQRANAGAIRNNIQKMLEDIYQLPKK